VSTIVVSQFVTLDGWNNSTLIKDAILTLRPQSNS
jgi:hypothetical protein